MLSTVRRTINAIPLVLSLSALPAGAQTDAAATVVTGAAPAGAVVRLDDVMAPDEQRRAGLSRLTADERAALERWLARYTASVAQGARAATSATPATGVTLADSRDHAGVYSPRRSAIAQGARLRETPRGADYVRLDDGTLWQIYLPDRPRVSAWQRGAWVSVRRAGAGTDGFDTVLTNGSDGSRALARLVSVDGPVPQP